MKKSIIFAMTAGIISLVAFSSCAFGFVPAWKSKSGKAKIALQFNTLDSLSRADSTDRAVIQGDGYLYIRTLGGPKSESGPLYGPYHLLPGEKFETLDVPAGTYSDMGFLFVATNVDAVKATYNGKEYTFRELMSLPDAEFNAMTNTKNTQTESPFDQILDGNASGKLYGKVTIKEGSVNSLKMTMEPITGSKSRMTLRETNSLELTSDGKTLVRKFIRLENYGDSMSTGTEVTEGVFTLVPDANAVIGKIAMFDEGGNPLATFKEITETGKPRTFKFVRTPNTSYFIYLEYIATSLTIEVLVKETTKSTLKVELLGDISVAGKRMFVGLHDSDITGNLIGSAVMTIAADGKASVTLNKSGTAEPIEITIGSTYYLSSFIDVNNNYAGVTDVSAVSPLDYMMPHYGDYATPDKYVPVTITGPDMKYQFLWSALEMTDSYVYFAANLASGSANGQTPANAGKLDAAIMYANSHATVFTQIFLTGSVDFNTTFPPIYSEMVITSAGPTRQTITVDSSRSFDLINGANVTLYNVIIDGANITRTTPVFPSLPSGATLNLSEGSSVIRFKGDGASNGGAVTVAGGNLTLMGGEISYCTADGSGGAVILGSGIVYLESGSIHHNSANFGGGIYMSGGNLTITGTAGINNNTAGTRGGGIIIEGGNITLSDSATIANNTAGSQGGGIAVEIAATSSTFMVSGLPSCITGNFVTANDPNCGAGVYTRISAAATAFTGSFVSGNTYFNTSLTSNLYYYP